MFRLQASLRGHLPVGGTAKSKAIRGYHKGKSRLVNDQTGWAAFTAKAERRERSTRFANAEVVSLELV